MDELAKIVRETGIDQWGVCGYEQTQPLLQTRSRGRIPADAACVIVLLFGYYTQEYTERNISRYAIVDDYHTVVRGILDEMAQSLNSLYPQDRFIPFVDASPIPEVRAAYHAGLGEVGRNGQLLNPVYGSYCFIGEIVSTHPFPVGQPTTAKLCVNCGQCVAACPTGALDAQGFVREKCRSEITQKKGDLTDWEREQIAAGGYVWGCDCCTDACPVNRRARASGVAAFWRDNTAVVGYANAGALCARKAYGWRGESLLRRNLDILSGKDML